MSETNVRRRITRALRPLHAISVENIVHPGTPDINYVGGWIELKWIPKWPVRKRTIVQCETFTPQQRIWIMNRLRAGGKVHMVLKIERDWVLLDGSTAVRIVGRSNKAELVSNALKIWERNLNDQQLLQLLSGN